MITISLIITILIYVLCNGCALQNFTNAKNNTKTDNTAFMSTQCRNITVYQRTDCLPQGRATEHACTTAGCCWDPLAIPNAPPCFYPNHYKGYFVQSHKRIPGGIRYTLLRNTTSGWPHDINTLQLDVTYEGSTRLHFKIYDPAKKRYEVPIHVTPGVERSPETTDFNVSVPTTGPFSLTVKRQGYSNVLFETGTIPIIFSDQYIQLGTLLETNLLYGLGERRSWFLLNFNWTKLTMWPHGQLSKIDYLYGQHPFFFNVESDQCVHGVFLLNSNAMEVELQPYPAVTYRTTGGILDFYIFSGPTADSVISQYTDLIGRPFIPPYWALGFNLCRWGYQGTSGLRKVIDRMRAANMPYDSMGHDDEYMENFKDWTYDNDLYYRLPDVVKDLHNHGQHYVIVVDAGISNSIPSGYYPPYDWGMKKYIFIKNPNGSGPIVGVIIPGKAVFPDYFHPNATVYWTAQARIYFNMVQFDGVMLDMNEPYNFYDGSIDGCPDNSLENPPFIPTGVADGKLRAGTLCVSARQYLSTHYNLHSLYGYSGAKVSMSALHTLRPNKRSLVLSRSTFPGNGVYGGHWLGHNNAEWEDMAYSISGILNFQMFGIPFVGADICGFYGDTTPELCTRWMQLGAFYPFMRNHNAVGFKLHYTQSIMRTALETRYSLLPYLYTLFYHSHVDGIPPVKPLFFNYPNAIESVIYCVDEQFMWGNSLLITPCLFPNITKGEGYLPEGRWYDFYNHTAVDSPGQTTMFDMPLERINIQVAAGTIFPMQRPNVTTTLSRKNQFSVYATLSSNGSAVGDLYWDDGESLDSKESGHYNFIEFSVHQRHFTVYVAHGGYTAEPMILDDVYILGVDIGPTSVLVNGEVTSKYTFNDQTLTVYGLSADLLKHLDISWTVK